MFFGESKYVKSFLFTNYRAVLWEWKHVNSFLFTNYHDLGLQGKSLGGTLAGRAASVLVMRAAGYGLMI